MGVSQYGSAPTEQHDSEEHRSCWLKASLSNMHGTPSGHVRFRVQTHASYCFVCNVLRPKVCFKVFLLEFVGQDWLETKSR